MSSASETVSRLVRSASQTAPRASGGEAGENADGEREAARCEGTVGGALHARVGSALESLVERAGAGGDQADAEERVEQAALHAGDAGLHGSQIEAAPAGDQDQADDFDFEEFAQVVDERGRGAGSGCMKRMRRGIDGEVRWRSGLGSGGHEDEE